MRILIISFSVFFSAAAVFVAALAIMLPTGKPAPEDSHAISELQQQVSNLRDELAGKTSDEAMKRLEGEQAAHRELVSELRQNVADLEDELERGNQGNAIERLSQEQATHRTIVSELRQNIADLENELERGNKDNVIERLSQEQTVHGEEVRQLREELALIQKEMESRTSRERTAAADTPEAPAKGPDPGEGQSYGNAVVRTDEEPLPPRYAVVTGAESTGKVVAILGGGFFPSGQETPTNELPPALQSILPEIVVSPNSMIVVEGHADSTPTKPGPEGRFADNRALSLRRAENIARLLEEEGVDPARISIAGFGDTKPLAPNTTPDGRAENRRVEIRLVPQIKEHPSR